MFLVEAMVSNLREIATKDVAVDKVKDSVETTTKHWQHEDVRQ